MKKQTALFFTVTMILFYGFAGCAGKTSPFAGVPGNLHDRGATESISECSEYILLPGDVIDVKFYYAPELNEQITIRPDGRISLQLIDEVTAAGMPPARLDALLTEKYSKILRKSEVAVIVKAFSGRKIYVGGEVNRPGLLAFENRMVPLQAILQAGGCRNTANLKNVVVLRERKNKPPAFYTINLKQHLTGDQSAKDFRLKPYDMVFVPKTKIARVGQFVDQYIRQVMPAALNFGFSYIYDLNEETYTTEISRP